ncbi:MAG: DUF4381 family protein [Alphaproteobacteria bacterium]|nr:DUF4381 family protein [Alphaproteobacteria bacterium]
MNALPQLSQKTDLSGLRGIRLAQSGVSDWLPPNLYVSLLLAALTVALFYGAYLFAKTIPRRWALIQVRRIAAIDDGHRRMTMWADLCKRLAISRDAGMAASYGKPWARYLQKHGIYDEKFADNIAASPYRLVIGDTCPSNEMRHMKRFVKRVSR